MKKRFRALSSRINLPEEEERILRFWQRKRIFEKSLAKNKGKKRFVFFEGPPTANAAPGLHHVEARAFKDLFPRYKTMRGYQVERKAGWDTHGLPIEIAVEKELGFTRKEEIERFGIAKFNALAKKQVWGFKEVWEKMTERIAFWLDLKKPYITYERDYVETLWWILKQIWQRGLLYRGHKVVPHCPRCGTALSSHEVAQGYREIEEPSLFVKFKVRNKKDTYFLAWTTTPWTLPGNVALAVDPKISYWEVEKNGERLILAESLARAVLGQFKKIRHFRGQALVGLNYEPLFPGAIKTNKKAWYVVPAAFVTAVQGTGIVHTSVMYGEEDYSLGEKFNLPMIHTVDEAGRFLPSAKKWAGRFVKDQTVEKEITADLKQRGLLFKAVPYQHDYPFCWRCETPLLYYAKASWFIRMSALKKELLTNNRQINWVPAHLKEGRFGEWLREVKDWAISRERYWGTPLPIWENQQGEKLVIGSFAELRKLAKDKKKIGRNFDPHRPWVDRIILAKNGQVYRRVPEVVDVWFDSGAMPFAQWHYPFENKAKVDRGLAYPADFIAEGVDQTRGWFYTLLAVSTLLGKAPAYKNVISLGHVLDKHGKKMSKSKGNVVEPNEIIDRYGADALRFYFYSVNQPGLPKNFDPQDVEKIVRNLILKFWNSLAFFTTYVRFSHFTPTLSRPKPKALLDRWILAVLDETTTAVTFALENFDVYSAAQKILSLADELSNWYLRRSRKRFFKNPDKKDEKEAYQTLFFVLRELARLLAPFLPFLAERLYQSLRLTGESLSVHLEDWPKMKITPRERRLIKEMSGLRELVEETLRLREEKGIRVRQPLAILYLLPRFSAEMKKILAEEVNVQAVKESSRLPSGRFIKRGKKVALDIKITPRLKLEGLKRETVRFLQQKRKELGLTVQDRMVVFWHAPDAELRHFLREKISELERETLSRFEETKGRQEAVMESGDWSFSLRVKIDE